MDHPGRVDLDHRPAIRRRRAGLHGDGDGVWYGGERRRGHAYGDSDRCGSGAHLGGCERNCNCIPFEAGTTAPPSLDVSTWFTAANVVPTYTLSAAPSWITLGGRTGHGSRPLLFLRIAPPSDVAAPGLHGRR